MAQVNIQKSAPFHRGLGNNFYLVWGKVDAVEVSHQLRHFCDRHAIYGNLFFALGFQVDGNFPIAISTVVVYANKCLLLSPSNQILVLVGAGRFSNATQIDALHKVCFTLSVVPNKNIQPRPKHNFLLRKIAVVCQLNLCYFHILFLDGIVCLPFVFGRKSFAVVFAKICAHVVQFLLQFFLRGMQFLFQTRRCIVDKFVLCFGHFSNQIFAVFLCKNGGVAILKHTWFLL